VLESPSHLYRKSGNYTICLQANGYGTCIDRYCRPLMAEVITAVDVPNAFTPNGDGANDVLYVRGVGVEELEFKVYNRWGQLVFETTDIRQGWDGTFKGKEQEMESYGYTLMVTFIDGSKIKKQGNITLLR
jgi:gliding motility-associated-like protein